MAFEDSKKKVETMDALAQLSDNLLRLGNVPVSLEIYDYAVKYFNLIAEFNDHYSVNPEMFKSDAQSVTELGELLSSSGREPYGYVRSAPGERVTLDNLYFGNRGGIWTFTARKFKEECANDEQVQNIIQAQIAGFIGAHRQPIMEHIDKVLHKEKRPNGILFRMFGNVKKKVK